MSYDFRIRETESPEPCAGCGRTRRRAYVDLGDPTYNLGDIFRRASDFRFEQGKAMPIPEARAMFRSMLAMIETVIGLPESDPTYKEWRALEPGNGWGTLETAERVCRTTFRALLDVEDAGGVHVEDHDDEEGPQRFVPVEQLRFSA